MFAWHLVFTVVYRGRSNDVLSRLKTHYVADFSSKHVKNLLPLSIVCGRLRKMKGDKRGMQLQKAL